MKNTDHDNKIHWVHVQVMRGSKQDVEAHGIRTSEARMNLTEPQRQARVDIDAGYEALEKGAGYALLGIKTANLMKIAKGEPSDAYIDALRAKAGRLHTWQFETPSVHVYCVEAINQRGFTARTYGELVGKHHDTIMDWYKLGLDSYVNLFYKGKK